MQFLNTLKGFENFLKLSEIRILFSLCRNKNEVKIVVKKSKNLKLTCAK